MSYHNRGSSSTSSTPSTTSTARQNTTNVQAQVAPPGFHYMPDGTLMSDAQHAALYNAPPVVAVTAPVVPVTPLPPPVVNTIVTTKVIKNFNIKLI